MVIVSKTSLQRQRQLSDAIAAHQPSVKRPKLDIVVESDDENSVTDKNDLYQSDNKSYNRAWYWNNSSEDDISDSDNAWGDNLRYGSCCKKSSLHRSVVSCTRRAEPK